MNQNIFKNPTLSDRNQSILLLTNVAEELNSALPDCENDALTIRQREKSRSKLKRNVFGLTFSLHL